FLNLAWNGVKYNRSDRPLVEVAAEPDPEGDPAWAAIAVRDNGIGIDPEHHEAIFQIFRRLHAPEEFEGTGAGLAICRKIAEAHGGSIRVDSRAGEGAAFRVRLPLWSEAGDARG